MSDDLKSKLPAAGEALSREVRTESQAQNHNEWAFLVN